MKSIILILAVALFSIPLILAEDNWIAVLESPPNFQGEVTIIYLYDEPCTNIDIAPYYDYHASIIIDDEEQIICWNDSGSNISLIMWTMNGSVSAYTIPSKDFERK